MCKATKLLESQIESLKKEKDSLNRPLSEVDKELSNFYHSIESIKFNAAEGYFIAKNLQKILRKRRKVKFEQVQLDYLVGSLERAKDKLKKNEEHYFRHAENYQEYIK